MTQDPRPVPNVVIKALFDSIISSLKNNNASNINELAQYAIAKYYQKGHRHFDLMQENFIDEYVDNESRVEGVHHKAEKEGLKLVYEYIFSDYNDSVIDVDYLIHLHEILFSKAPFPEAGGKFRSAPARLEGAVVSLCPWPQIQKRLYKTNKTIQSIVKESDEVRQSNNKTKLFNYIEQCLKLKCELIQIHPFSDGNGRTVRAFINKLFSLAGIPPVYVHYKEKKHYHIAMEKAITENDFSSIIQFYYIKICQSIYELDINPSQDLKLKTDLKKIKKVVENYKVALSEETSNISDLSTHYSEYIKQELDEEGISSIVMSAHLDKDKVHNHLIAPLKKVPNKQLVLIDPFFSNLTDSGEISVDPNMPPKDRRFLTNLYHEGVCEVGDYEYSVYLQVIGDLDKTKEHNYQKTITR